MSFTDIDGAISAMTSALESMEKRIAALSEEIYLATGKRRQQLDGQVEWLLPNFSSLTYEKLQAEVPTFAAKAIVMTAFSTHSKRYGIFKSDGYDVALALTKTHLKSFLEINPDAASKTASSPSALPALQSENALLADQHMQTLDLLKSLESAKKSGASLPFEARVNINRIADKGRTIAASPVGASAPRSASFISSSPVQTTQISDSNTDLWLWMMTDIPSSFRTLMLGSFAGPHVHASSATTNNLESPQFMGGTGSGLAMSVPGLMADVPIATDDRLGAFS